MTNMNLLIVAQQVPSDVVATCGYAYEVTACINRRLKDVSFSSRK